MFFHVLGGGWIFKEGRLCRSFRQVMPNKKERRWVPHIWPGFGQMWELTGAGAIVPVAPENFSPESS
jgi:hypothetical protein